MAMPPVLLWRIAKHTAKYPATEPEEYNVLINPSHTDARRIKSAVLRQYIYDPRL